MQIAGLQKTTLVDYPGKVAATVFTRGCSFRCPFCHNPELVLPERFSPLISVEGFFQFLEKRQGKLQGVCITGGEPLLHADAGRFAERIKKLGFLVKLDTNGSFPDRLKELIDSGNLDYIAMDIKSPLSKYAQTAQISNFKYQISNKNPKTKLEQNNLEEKNKIKDKGLQSDIKKSISLIMNSSIDYEFRTTVCHPLHLPEDFEEIGKLIKGAKRYYIQNFVHSKHNDEKTKFEPFTELELENALQIISQEVKNSVVR